jgi:cell wall assembly regulator SMI1
MESMRAIARDLVAALAKLDPPPDPRFRGPVQEEAIRQARVKLGVALDDDLIEFLRCIDGQEPEGAADFCWFPGDPIVPMFRFGPDPVQFTAWGWLLGVEQIVEHTLRYRGMAEENADEIYECIGPACFHGDYIQLVSSENPTSIAIDLRPLEGGVVGQIVAINDQPNYVVVLAPNLREFLRSIADGYENGRFKYADGNWSEP